MFNVSAGRGQRDKSGTLKVDQLTHLRSISSRRLIIRVWAVLEARRSWPWSRHQWHSFFYQNKLEIRMQWIQYTSILTDYKWDRMCERVKLPKSKAVAAMPSHLCCVSLCQSGKATCHCMWNSIQESNGKHQDISRLTSISAHTARAATCWTTSRCFVSADSSSDGSWCIVNYWYVLLMLGQTEAVWCFGHILKLQSLSSSIRAWHIFVSTNEIKSRVLASSL